MSRIQGLDTKTPPFEIIVMGPYHAGYRRARAIRGVVHVHIDDAECESERDGEHLRAAGVYKLDAITLATWELCG